MSFAGLETGLFCPKVSNPSLHRSHAVCVRLFCFDLFGVALSIELEVNGGDTIEVVCSALLTLGGQVFTTVVGEPGSSSGVKID